MTICAAGSLIIWLLNGAKIIFKCPVIDAFEAVIAIQAVQQFDNICTHPALVYSVSINLQPLLWVLLSPSLPGRQCHPEGGDERWCGQVRKVSSPDATLSKVPMWGDSQRGCDPVIPPQKSPSDTYRNTWLSRGSCLPSLPRITLV